MVDKEGIGGVKNHNTMAIMAREDKTACGRSVGEQVVCCCGLGSSSPLTHRSPTYPTFPQPPHAPSSVHSC